MIYTPLEAKILLILKDNIEQPKGIAPETLLMGVAEEIYVTQTLPGNTAGDLVKTLAVLVAEGLVNRLEDYNAYGVYCVVGYKITRDGLRAARSVQSS